MAGGFVFVQQTQNVANQNFLGYYADNAYGMLFRFELYDTEIIPV